MFSIFAVSKRYTFNFTRPQKMDKLTFYKRCYEDCKRVLKEISENADLDKDTKERLTDHLLDRMNKFKEYIDYLMSN